MVLADPTRVVRLNRVDVVDADGLPTPRSTYPMSVPVRDPLRHAGFRPWPVPLDPAETVVWPRRIIPKTPIDFEAVQNLPHELRVRVPLLLEVPEVRTELVKGQSADCRNSGRSAVRTPLCMSAIGVLVREEGRVDHARLTFTPRWFDNSPSHFSFSSSIASASASKYSTSEMKPFFIRSPTIAA